MTNIALNKPILEDEVIRPNEATDGETTGFGGHSGFAKFAYPGTMTVDLEKICEIRCVRILLWYKLRKDGESPISRRYRYRLELSPDGDNWNEIYTSPSEGNIGWQIFKLYSNNHIRYIRIYGLHNTANKNFHIVEVEAHDTIPPEPDGFINIEEEFGDFSSTEQGEIFPEEEVGSDVKISEYDIEDLRDIAGNMKKSPLMDKTMIQQFEKQIDELDVLWQKLGLIRKEIVHPVTEEISDSNQLITEKILESTKLAKIALGITIVLSILNVLFTPAGQTVIKWVKGIILPK